MEYYSATERKETESLQELGDGTDMDTLFTLGLKQGGAETGCEQRSPLSARVQQEPTQHCQATQRQQRRNGVPDFGDTRIFTDEMTGWQGCASNNRQGNR